MHPIPPATVQPRAGRAACALAFTLAAASLLIPGTAPAAVDSHDGSPDQVPVVDMHTHVFNAHDLPMAGILNSLGVPLPVNHALTKVLNNLTPADDLTGSVPPRPVPTPGIKAAAEEPTVENLREVTAETLLDNAKTKPNLPATNSLFGVLSPAEREQLLEYVGRTAPGEPPLPDPVGGPDGLKSFSALDQHQQDLEILAMALEKANFPPGESDAEPTSLKGALDPDRSGHLAFVGVMTKGNLEIAVGLRNQQYPEVDLFVHHMMDMEKSYDSKPEMSFEAQISRMKKLDQRMEGSFVHFVAFDPFRRGDALELVKRGFKEGAIGVKFYPPSGYRPAGNAIPKEPSIFYPGSRARWNSRYKDLNADKLDEINNELFKHCVEKDIPVFTHCTPKGFEADADYGHMADPKYWALVLKNHPKLRLCFGHSGGHAFWFAEGAGPAPAAKEYSEYLFGKKVVELCLKYENVYCEVGYLEQILNDNMREVFKNKLKEQIKAPGQYRFGDKIMYGSDWHMIHKEKHHLDYPNAFNQLFADPDLGPWQRAFFCRNASNYLQLSKLAEKTSPYTPQQQKCWTDLLVRINAGPSSSKP